jgi:hypothetical protein
MGTQGTLAMEEADLALLELVAVEAKSEESALRMIVKQALRDRVRQLKPDEFERSVARMLERRGYRVRRLGGAGDEGIDLLARRGEVTIAVQCKRYDEEQLITPSATRGVAQPSPCLHPAGAFLHNVQTVVTRPWVSASGCISGSAQSVATPIVRRLRLPADGLATGGL